MTKKYMKLEVSDDYLLKLGKIAAYHSAVDHSLRLTVTYILNTKKEIGNYLIYRKSTDSLLEMVKQIIKIQYGVDDEIYSIYIDWKMRFKEKCQEKRNHYLHGLWGVNIEEEMTSVYRLISEKGEIKSDFQIITVEDLSKVIGDYSELLFEYIEIIMKNIAKREGLIMEN